jgi:hypothetical protein
VQKRTLLRLCFSVSFFFGIVERVDLLKGGDVEEIYIIFLDLAGVFPSLLSELAWLFGVVSVDIVDTVVYCLVEYIAEFVKLMVF